MSIVSMLKTDGRGEVRAEDGHTSYQITSGQNTSRSIETKNSLKTPIKPGCVGLDCCV